MKLPTLPTDNLYKFLALTGLVVALASVIFPYSKEYDSAIDMMEILQERKLLVIETKYLKVEVEAIRKTETHGDASIQLLEKLKEIELRDALLTAKREQQDYIQLHIELLNKYSKRSFVIGIILSALGFLLWYFKVQRYQDKRLKKRGDDGT